MSQSNDNTYTKMIFTLKMPRQHRKLDSRAGCGHAAVEDKLSKNR